MDRSFCDALCQYEGWIQPTSFWIYSPRARETRLNRKDGSYSENEGHGENIVSALPRPKHSRPMLTYSMLGTSAKRPLGISEPHERKTFRQNRPTMQTPHMTCSLNINGIGANQSQKLSPKIEESLMNTMIVSLSAQKSLQEAEASKIQDVVKSQSSPGISRRRKPKPGSHRPKRDCRSLEQSSRSKSQWGRDYIGRDYGKHRR